jgi:hypothetical protein
MDVVSGDSLDMMASSDRTCTHHGLYVGSDLSQEPHSFRKLSCNIPLRGRPVMFGDP